MRACLAVTLEGRVLVEVLVTAVRVLFTVRIDGATPSPLRGTGSRRSRSRSRTDLPLEAPLFAWARRRVVPIALRMDPRRAGPRLRWEEPAARRLRSVV